MNDHEFKIKVFPLKDKLFRFARRMLDQTEEAEDVTQDILMRLWNKKHELDHYDNIEAVAMQSVKNLCLDKLKHRKVKNRKMQVLKDHQVNSFTQETVENNEIQGIIQTIISELPDNQKIVIHLKDIEGYTTEEIEQMLDMNVNTIRANLSRARKKVKGQMSKIMNYGL